MKKFYNNRKVLVTGGAGFIGSHIAEQLVQLGAHVTVLDNLSTGFLQNLNHIKNNLTFIQGTITDFDTVKKTCKNQETIFHCAAQVSVPQSFEQPDLCYTTNATGTHTILEAARVNSVKKVIFSSSSAVYGPQTEPCHEAMKCNPQSPYGFSKLQGELLCQEYAQLFGLHTVSLRYFNVYGPRQDPNGPYAGVIAKFRKLISNNKPITLFGTGKQTRDFIPVEQVATINLQCGVPLKSQPQPEHLVLNVATGRSITLLDLVEQLKQKHPLYNHKTEYAPARSGDITHSAANCSRLDFLRRQFMV